MLFNSVSFLGLAAALLAVWPLVRGRSAARWLTLTVASLVFYGYHAASRWPSLAYLAVAGGITHVLARAIERDRERSRRWLALALAATLGGLVTFKLAGPCAALANARLGTRLPTTYPVPLAVSFISLGLASYVLDVHRRALPACRSLLQFLAYVTFFPKLIAGPVVRGAVLLPQLAAPPRTTAEGAWLGCRQFAVGLFLKNVVADNLAPTVEAAFASNLSGSSGHWWLVAVLYTTQSYADFCGYSEMGIGIARILGFALPANFAHPFAAAGFREFWGRWHISVSTWFRDYLFYPAARRWLPHLRGWARHLAVHALLWLVMLTSGIWHGPVPGYVLWGLLHAAYLSIETAFDWPARLSRLPGGRLVAVLATVALWAFSQLVFRAGDLSTALHVAKAMLSFGGSDVRAVLLHARPGWPLLVIAVVVQHVWAAWRDGRLPRWLSARADCLEPAGVAALIVLAVVFRGPSAGFVYLQF